jgi:hypothetical protein
MIKKMIVALALFTFSSGCDFGGDESAQFEEQSQAIRKSKNPTVVLMPQIQGDAACCYHDEGQYSWSCPDPNETPAKTCEDDYGDEAFVAAVEASCSDFEDKPDCFGA